MMKKNLLSLALICFGLISNAQLIEKNNVLVVEKTGLDVILNYKKEAAKEGANYYTIVGKQRAYFQALRAQNGFSKEENKAFKHFERWAYFWRDRVSADGAFPSMLEGYKNARVLEPTMSHRRTNSLDSWENIGPIVNPLPNGYPNPPQLGRINTFWRFVDGTDASKNVLLVGAPTGGIWKSTDNGATWTPKFDKFAGIGITDIKGSSSNASTAGVLYASTGDYDGSEVLNSIGVYKSTDMGETWTATGLSFALSGAELLGQLVVYDANTVVVTAKSTIKRTTDGGTTWTDVHTGSLSESGFGRMTSFGDSIVASDALNGLYFSINKGVNWKELQSPSLDGKHAICTDENGKFFVQDELGQIKALDLINETITNIGVKSSGYSAQGGYNQILLKRGGLLLDGSVNGNSSSDNGANWYQSLNGYKTDPSDPGVYIHSDFHQAGYLDAGLSFWMANDGGVSFVKYSSASDQAPTIDYKTNGVIVTQCYTISINPKDSVSDDFLMANQDNDGFSKEGGKWVSVVAGDGVCSAIDYVNPNIRYVGGTEGKLTRSDQNLGYTSNYEGVPLTTPGNAEFVWPLSLHTTTSTTLYGGFDEMYVSTDKGDNWTSLNSGAGKIVTFDNQGDYIAAIGKDTDAYKFSSNGGTNWSTIAAPGNFQGINSVSIDAASTGGKTIYATVKGYTTGSKVFKSIDAGATWTNISGNMPNILMKKVLFKQNQTSEILYVGTELGVYHSTNGGSTWAKLGVNFPNVIVNDLKINYLNDRLYVGTYGRGMWYIPMSVKIIPTGINEILEKEVTVYPNPVTAKKVTVNIENNSQDANYVIYNVVGGVISKGTLDNQTNEINLENIVGGTYMVRIQVGEASVTRKLIIQ